MKYLVTETRDLPLQERRYGNIEIRFDCRKKWQNESVPGVPDDEGKLYTVRYDAVNAMLRNEFLKKHGKVEELEAIA
jgi:hypothetical protein